MKHLLTAILLLTSGCSFRAAYPSIGSGIGAGVGSLGGVGGAIGGSMVGSAVGTAMMETGEHDLIKAQVEALTSGDVAALIEQKASEERSIFDKIISGIYQTLILAGIALAVWVMAPIAYRWWRNRLHQKIEKRLNGDE